MLESYIRYRQPLHFDDLIDVRLRLARCTRTTFQMAYLVTVDDSDGTEPARGVRATGVTVHGCVTTEGRPTRLPAWLVELGAAATRLTTVGAMAETTTRVPTRRLPRARRRRPTPRRQRVHLLRRPLLRSPQRLRLVLRHRVRSRVDRHRGRAAHLHHRRLRRPWCRGAVRLRRRRLRRHERAGQPPQRRPPTPTTSRPA